MSTSDYADDVKVRVATSSDVKSAAQRDQEAEERRRRSSIRRMSVYRRLSTVSYRKSSAANSVVDLALASPTRAPDRFENTFQLQPVEGQRFNSSKVKNMVDEILSSYLDGEGYEEKKCKMMAKNLSDVIRGRVKNLAFPRYKIVCSVTIGQIDAQSLQMSSRCLWSPEYDSFSTSYYKNTSLFCTALVYGIYMD